MGVAFRRVIAAGSLVVAVYGTSCDVPVPGETPGLSGTLEVTDFTVASGESRRVSGDLIINASGAVTIAGTLSAEDAVGHSLTIQAAGDVGITGLLSAGQGAPGGGRGGDITIVSMNGNISITGSGSLVAGDGGSGQTTTTARSILAIGKRPVLFKSVSGGAGGAGGSVTLRAPNGEITVANVEGIIHLGNGGDGATIEVHGEDLLTTEMAEELENAGGDSGVLMIEALTFNGVDIAGQTAFVPESAMFLSGGTGGNAGDLFWGVDAEGNSTFPDEDTTSQLIATVKRGGANLRPIFPDLRLMGARGGDAWLGSAGRGANLQIRGRDGTTPGTDGQNVFATGGSGGDCIQQRLCDPGDGGDADATGGDGARGEHTTGDGGAGGNAGATGGSGGRDGALSTVIAGGTGNAIARGGAGAKGGGLCPDNVSDMGGPGGAGGSADAMVPFVPAVATAVGGRGGDGGDGESASGAVGGGGSALALGGPDSSQVAGANGSAGAKCGPVQALALSFGFIGSLGEGSTVRLSCVVGGAVSGVEDGCRCEHLHGAITITGIPGGPFDDPDDRGCGHGCIVTVRESELGYDCN